MNEPQLNEETVSQLMGGKGDGKENPPAQSTESKSGTENKLSEEQEKEVLAYAASLEEKAAVKKDEIIEEPKLDGVDPKVVSYINSLKEKASKPMVVNEIPQEVQEKVSRLNSYDQNPMVKSFADFVTSGGKVEELFIKGGKDYDTMPDAEVVSEYFGHIYASPEEQPKIAGAVKDFNENNKLQYQRDMQIKNFRKELKDSNPSSTPAKFQEVLGKHNDSVKQMIDTKNAQSRAIQEKIQKASGELESKVKAVKDFNGVAINESDRVDLFKIASYHMPIKQNGTDKELDVDAGLNIALTLKYFNQAIKKARIDGYTDAKRGFHAPSVQSSQNGASTKKDVDAVSAFKEMFPIETIPITDTK